MNIRQTPATVALGCGGSLIAFGGFVSGFYVGFSEKTGNPVDYPLANFLKFGPTVLAAAYSPLVSLAQLNVPENLEALTNIAPEVPESCHKSCGITCSTIIGAGLVGGMTYLGYAIGHAVG
jgi:hypothetical protein